ncbi:small acid-soluble spore protein SspI [Paenibacillus koleovorans]|uniref:small acid-soluble spore protein SspI n=1 Tax=Paenibacillus koleovorans TaxID=121608 RepID=UPI001FEAAED7|nr:small acid-soluble spore protein SspI [Paenibacillus koleovorans]
MIHLNLRQAIVNRVHGKSAGELQELLTDSLHGDELALPGLGVLFEIIWEHTPEDVQAQLAQTLKEQLDLREPVSPLEEHPSTTPLN